MHRHIHRRNTREKVRKNGRRHQKTRESNKEGEIKVERMRMEGGNEKNRGITK
jgi:hypothetical protein